MRAIRTFTDQERRARLTARHHLGATATSVLDAVRGVAAFHSSDPTTPHLGLRARVPGYVAADLDTAVAETRVVCRMHAMRRTLFVIPTDDVPVFRAGAARAFAARERRRIEGWLAAELGDGYVRDRLPGIEQRVVDELAATGELSTRDLSARVEELATELTVGSGRWSARVPVSSRLLQLMAMDGRIVRAGAAGTWRSSQYRWAESDAWFGRRLAVVDEHEGRRELVRRYLAGHGPATVTDLRWWTGWTVGMTRAALASVGALEVDLGEGPVGYVLPGDVEPTEPVSGVVALLPSLDPTVMGWKDRAWYLGTHGGVLFDGNGNAGPTIWVDGRVVGGWTVHPGGAVVTRMLEDVGGDARGAVDEAAASLLEWLGADVVTPRFRTPLERELSS